MSYKVIVFNTEDLVPHVSSRAVESADKIDRAMSEDYEVAFSSHVIADGKPYVVVYLHKKPNDVERYGFNLESPVKPLDT